MANILIVGEDIGRVDLMATTVEALGYEVVTLYESFDAIDEALKQPYDLVMLDATMSGLTGYEVSSALRGDPEIDEKLPILMFDNGSLDDAKLKSSGITDTILPEIAPSTLTEILVKFIGE